MSIESNETLFQALFLQATNKVTSSVSYICACENGKFGYLMHPQLLITSEYTLVGLAATSNAKKANLLPLVRLPMITEERHSNSLH